MYHLVRIRLSDSCSLTPTGPGAGIHFVSDGEATRMTIEIESTVPALRIQTCTMSGRSDVAPVQPDGEFVLYWMIAHRRTTWNFSLQRAADWARGT